MAPGGGSSLANDFKGPRSPSRPISGARSPGIPSRLRHPSEPRCPRPKTRSSFLAPRLLAARSQEHSAGSQHPYAGGAAHPRPLQPTLPRPFPRVPALSPIPALPPVSAFSQPRASSHSGHPFAQTSQLQGGRSPHPPAPRGPGRKQNCLRGARVSPWPPPGPPRSASRAPSQPSKLYKPARGLRTPRRGLPEAGAPGQEM